MLDPKGGGVAGYMKRVYQNDPAMPDAVKKYACFAFSLIAIPEEIYQIPLNIQQKIDFIDDMIRLEVLAIDMTVMSINQFLYEANRNVWSISKKSMVEIIMCGEHNLKVRRRNWGYWDGDYTVIHGLTEAGNEHYRFGNSEEQLLWDPYHPERNIIEEISVQYYKIV